MTSFDKNEEMLFGVISKISENWFLKGDVVYLDIVGGVELKQQYKIAIISKLDSICIKSDGDLTEKFYQVTKELFYSHLTAFVDYISSHPNSCLKATLIEGLSADMSVYEGNERSEQIKQEKQKTLEKAKKLKLSIQQIQIIETIFKAINPAYSINQSLLAPTGASPMSLS